MPAIKRKALVRKEKIKSFFAEEWRDTIIAVLLLTLIFAYDFQNPANTFSYLLQAFLASGTALLVHKIAHKLLARKFGCIAYYKIWVPGIVFALLLMVAGFKLPAIGFVFVHPYAFARWGFKSRRLSMMEEGITGAVGPAANILFAIALRAFPGASTGTLLSYMSFVSAYFAIFNLLPIKPLDGFKIMFWKPWFWLFLVIINALIFFV